MSSDGSITHWLDEIKGGNHAAAQALWERYFAEMVRVARKNLGGAARRVADEEDVAASVFESFYQAAEKGRFPDLADRDSLWRLLVRMTARKAIDQKRREGRLRRGGGRVHNESALQDFATSGDTRALAQVVGDTPTPDFVAMMTEQIEVFLTQLADDDLRQIALGKMEGYTNDQMAEQRGCSRRTVERRLKLIREQCRQSDYFNSQDDLE